LKNPEELEGLGELQRRVRVKAEGLRVNQMQIIQMFRNRFRSGLDFQQYSRFSYCLQDKLDFRFRLSDIQKIGSQWHQLSLQIIR